MKLTIHPVRQMKKGRTKVWVECAAIGAHAFELRNKAGKTLRREPNLASAERIRGLFSKAQPAKDRRTLIGKRWADVKNKL